MTRARLLRIGLLITTVAGFGVLQAGLAIGAEATVECGIIREYTAPDPGTSTAGAIAFGVTGPVEPIAADATLVGATATNLPFLVGGVPTCVTATRDAGTIVQLEFAASGSVSGLVVFEPDLLGPGQDAYVVDDRLLVPVDVLATSSGLSALIKVPADSNTTTSITFQIDTASGFPTGLDGTTTVSGAVAVVGNGDVTVGASTLTADLIDAASLALLQSAADLGVAATVTIHGVGTIDIQGSGGVIVVTTLAVAVAAPSAAPSATPAPSAGLLPDTAMAR